MICFFHNINESWFKDGRLILLTFFDPVRTDIVNNKLSKIKFTFKSLLCRARTVEVGIPTNPAPKQAILYDFI